MAPTNKKLIAQNKKARHDYFIDDTIEAGIELFGTEVKSLRSGAVNLKDSFCRFKDGELFALGIHISPYEQGNIFNKEPRRDRKLLLHRRELDRLFGAVGKKGFSIIPLSLYFSGKWVKVEIGVCRGKKLYDKREDDAKKTMDMEMRRNNTDRF